MNVIRQPKRGGGNLGGSRPLVKTNNQKPRGRGRGALDFDLIQFRPGQRTISTSSSGEMRTPSNLELQMGIISSARRVSSSTSLTGTMSTPSNHSLVHPMLRHRALARQTSSSSSAVTPRTTTCMGPPKTPRFNSFTPRNSMIVSSTPRTTPTSASTGDLNHSHVILEGRGHARGEVGLAVIDVKRPRLILCQLSDRQTYVNTLVKISVFQPVEILIPNTFVDSNQPNKLYKLLEEKFPHVNMVKVQRRLFRDSEGLEKVQHLCLPQNSSCQLILQEKFYALAAAAALLKYVEFVQNVIFAAHSLKVEYQGAHHGTIIDVKTAKNLELLLNQQSNNATHTLINIMDHCCTQGGSRLLRASLLHPPCSLPIITKRQDSVQELVENPDMGQKIREVLQQLPDVEQLLTLCMQTPSTLDNTQAIDARVNYVLQLKTTLETLPHVVAALENVQSFLLCKAKKCLQDPRGDVMKARILQTLNEDVKAPKGGKTAIFQKCFAVKSGVNELMDVARKTYCELINDMHEHVIELGSSTSLPLKMNYSVTRGYHIQITTQKNHPVKKEDLPPQFVQVLQSRNNLTCTTDTIILANERIKFVTTDILTMSNTLLTTILNDIREHMNYLYEMCESIAEVDIALSLSQISRSHNYVRPKFGDKLCLKLSRHPILESITSCDPIANDVEATSWKNLSVVTGPNMSGKSIYIRQVLLLQIMAQVGCYIPAEEATFRITDRIYSHLNFDDSIENNASTLALEMKEIQLILSSTTPTSMVALDELCRGTSVEEGTAIAWSLCEELSQSSAFVFVTTHFRELTRLSSLYPSVKNIHLETVEHEFSDKKCRLVYTHRLLPGINPVENYGLRLAENLDVPKTILQMTSTFSSQIRSNTEVNLTSAQGDETYTLALGLHKLKVLIAENDGLTVDELKTAQLEMMKDMTDARQRAENAMATFEDAQVKAPPHKPKLCDYSSSEAEFSLTAPNPAARGVQEEIVMLSENPYSGSDYDSPVRRSPHPETELRSSPTQSCSSPAQSCTGENNFPSPSSTFNMTNLSIPATPESTTSFHSQHTWLVGAASERSNSFAQSTLLDGGKSRTDSSDSDSGSPDSNNFRSKLSRVGEDRSMSSSVLSEMCDDNVSRNNASFPALFAERTGNFLDSSIQSKGKSSTDFFSQSTVIFSQASASSNPFQRLPEADNSFQSLFRITNATPAKKTFPLSCFEPTEEAERGISADELSFEVFKTPLKSVKRPAASSPTSDRGMSPYVGPAASSPSSDRGMSPYVSPPEKRTRPERKNEEEERASRGGLQMLMDSYGSDSDSN